ncbi:hypothetical protein G5I_06115 [Acromyrmex echinatior]|uniref:Uncharacterized protein n=1 Tax=Acromyrmex echinatior TaxID=103372 RepID=F4WK72_ACREC|nr:hypothetical protein G5I_06115 [Acromyrmex echinatior]
MTYRWVRHSTSSFYQNKSNNHMEVKNNNNSKVVRQSVNTKTEKIKISKGRSQDSPRETWITNTFVKNLRMMIGCIQTYMVHQRKIDPNTIRMREAKTIKDALMSFLNVLKTRGLLNSTYSVEELDRFFSISESKVLHHWFMEYFMTRNTYFEWLHDLKEYVRCHMATLIDAPNIDRKIFASSGESTSGGMDALFASISKQQNDGISQYMTKLEHDLYDIHDIKNKEKRQWWKYAKMRTQFVTSSPRDRKQQVVNRLLDWIADDLRKVPSLMKEKKNVL